jgi:hypothetical protein
MKATLEAISPLGYRVQFEIEESADLAPLLHRLADLEAALEEVGFTPTSEPPLTPDGLPVCRRHRAVMHKREKQGDEWFSHKIVVGGQELYCKGRPGPDSPGWDY